VVLSKNLDPGFATVNGTLINLPSTLLIPDSVKQKLPEWAQKQIISKRENEMGHIVYHHIDTTNNLVCIGASIIIFSFNGGLKYGFQILIIVIYPQSRI
jgi:hypothetical protein